MLSAHNYRQYWVIICLLSIALFITGCTTTTPKKVAVRTVYTQPETGVRNRIRNSFNLQGRVAFRNPQQRNSGNIRWQHTPAEDDISLFSPLGQTVAVIRNNAQGAQLITAEKKNYHANNVENLTKKVLGWRLPLTGLQYWILGQHAPATAAEKDLDQNEQVIAIRQDGWNITYPDYFPAEHSRAARPRIIELKYNDLKIRLVIDSWQSI